MSWVKKKKNTVLSLGSCCLLHKSIVPAHGYLIASEHGIGHFTMYTTCLNGQSIFFLLLTHLKLGVLNIKSMGWIWPAGLCHLTTGAPKGSGNSGVRQAGPASEFWDMESPFRDAFKQCFNPFRLLTLHSHLQWQVGVGPNHRIIESTALQLGSK